MPDILRPAPAGVRPAGVAFGELLLGMAADASFRTGRVQLGVGDILLACSDGVIESRNNADQEFGDERLEAECGSHEPVPLIVCSSPSWRQFRISPLRTR